MQTPVARIILDQLGGHRFCLMTGARDLIGGNNFLQFALPRNESGINKVRIVLETSDLYSLEFFNIAKRGLHVKPIAWFHGVYFDQLRPLFTKATGLDTSL